MATKKEKELKMSSAEDLFAEIDGIFEKNNIVEGMGYQSQPTGLDVLDFSLGKKTNNEYFIGLNPAHLVSIIGSTGVGKSTLALQLASSLVRPYDKGKLIDLDIERAHTIERFKYLSGWSDEEIARKYSLKRDGLYTENIFESIKKLCEIKNANKDKLKEKDYYGNDYLLPTAVVLDSISLMYPFNSLDEAEINKGHEDTLKAKINNAFAKKAVNMIGSSNVSIITVNHIHTKIQKGIVPEPAEIYGMKQEETLPGGKGFPNMSDTLLRLDGKTKLKSSELYGINGNVIRVTIIKSRNARSLQTFDLVFNPVYGFDNDLSNLHFLKENKLVEGGGNSYKIVGFPDFKFAFSNFKTKLNANPKLREELNEVMIGHLSQIIDGNYNNEVNEELEVMAVEPVVEE